MFYDNYIRLCALKNKTPAAVAKEIGIERSNVTHWKNGRNKPTDITIAKLADYFGVDPSVLTGDKQKNLTAQMGSEVDEVTMELLDMVNNSTEKERRDMLEMLRLLKKQRETR